MLHIVAKMAADVEMLWKPRAGNYWHPSAAAVAAGIPVAAAAVAAAEVRAPRLMT